MGDIHELQLWPDGVFVRRFYEARKPRINADPVNVVTSSGARGECAPEAHAPAERICEYDL